MVAVTLFKSKTPTHSVQFVNGMASFYNGRFATDNKQLEDEMREILSKQHRYCGITVDPAEPTVDYIADNGFSLKQQVAIDFMRRKNTQSDFGSNDRASGIGGANTQDNPVLGGTGALAPAFTVAESRNISSGAQTATQILRAKLAGAGVAATETGLVNEAEKPVEGTK